MQINIFQLWSYFNRHWFKLCLLFLIIVAALKRDMSFSIQLGNKTAANEKRIIPETNKATNVVKGTELSITGTLFNDRNVKNEPIIAESVKVAYLKRFAQTVVNEQKKFGIPASITLSIAFIQSKSGTADRCIGANNHFDLLATSDWKGATYNYENLNFRKYNNSWLSFRDHSLYLTSGKFSELKNARTTNYKTWLKNLQKLGYADNSESFLKDIQETIEKYKLNRLDAK